jgi:hypothetical protein
MSLPDEVIPADIQLYLPRTYSSALADGKVMIGHQANRGGEDAVSNALMSLLREGAPWDEGDEKRAKGSNLDLKGNNDSDEWNKEPENRNDVVRLALFQFVRG